MVHHHVKNHFHAALMRLLNEVFQILFRAHIGIDFRPVLMIIAVITVMREIAFTAATDPAVHLFERRTYPNRIDTKLL